MSDDAAASEPAGTARPSVHTVDPAHEAAHKAQRRRTRLRGALALSVFAVSTLLIVTGTWTYDGVERSLRELRTDALQSVLHAQAKTLEVWIANQEHDIHRLARDANVRAQVRALVDIANQPGVLPEQYCTAPARRPLVTQLNDALSGSGAVAFNVIDRSGRIVASQFRAYCGSQVSRFVLEQGIEPAFHGETRFVRPHAETARLAGPPPQPPLDRALVWVETPVRDDDGEIIAALGVGEYAHAQFAAILTAARGGDSGEVYAFDRRGVMLSESRFVGDIDRRDDHSAGEPTTLTLQLQPPGSAAGTATRLVEAAREGIAGGQLTGVLLDPYPSYHGGTVVGAWQWLPALDMGIAAEMSAEEAYAPLAVLRYAFGGVFAALAVSVVAVLAAWFSVALLRTESSRRLRVGSYVLGERIGEGGIANVYMAQHDLLKRPTAVKLLKSRRATDEMTARFKREAQLASQLSHPNTIEIFDYGLAPDGLFYYAMEYLDGETVQALVKRSGAMPVARVVHLLRQVCAALAEAHGKGLVHRDISPSNIMVCHHGGEYDFAKIIDFGLVKNFAEPHSHTITRTLRLLGTPLYMAPERLRDPADVDARTDIYSLGTVAYFMLTGHDAFDSPDEMSLTTKVLNEPAPSVSGAAAQAIPRELDALIAACLHKQREDRPQRVVEMLEVLESIARAERWTQRDAEAAWQAQRAPDASAAAA
jgi:serine/threonine-protein kinase